VQQDLERWRDKKRFKYMGVSAITESGLTEEESTASTTKLHLFQGQELRASHDINITIIISLNSGAQLFPQLPSKESVLCIMTCRM